MSADAFGRKTPHPNPLPQERVKKRRLDVGRLRQEVLETGEVTTGKPLTPGEKE